MRRRLERLIALLPWSKSGKALGVVLELEAPATAQAVANLLNVDEEEARKRLLRLEQAGVLSRGLVGRGATARAFWHRPVGD